MFPAGAGMNRILFVILPINQHVPRWCGDEPGNLPRNNQRLYVPRWCGDEPVLYGGYIFALECSPLVRG